MEFTRKRTTARQCDIPMLFVVQCTLVKSGAVHTGLMQCILVKSDEFENSFPLTIFFFNPKCCCSVPTLAPQ